jgi:hypothetical protein
MRYLVVLCFLLLSACIGRSTFPALSSGINPSVQPQPSRVGELLTGMTLADASRVVGPAVQSFDNPSSIGHVCFSHPYQGTDGKLFIHTIYLGGNMVSASDGHNNSCGPSDF